MCFAVFLINDLYGFAEWRRMQKDSTQKNFSLQILRFVV